jgi:hypothetical protein
VIRAQQLRAKQEEAKIRVVFIGYSDRSVGADSAGCTGAIGYSVRSEKHPWQVELKYEGCADTSECSDGPDCAQVPAHKLFEVDTTLIARLLQFRAKRKLPKADSLRQLLPF